MSYTLGAYTNLPTSSIKKSPNVLLRIFSLSYSSFLVFLTHISFPASKAPDEVSVRENLTIPNPPLPIISLSNPFLFCKFYFVFEIFSSTNPSGI